IYVRQKDFTFMVGASNGMINGNVKEVDPTTVAPGNDKKAPSIYGKVAYDTQFEDGLRLRLAGSLYHNGNSGRNTLYAGDRTGSNYFMVMDPESGSYTANYTSGRFSPNFTNKITAAMFNAFVKYEGAELFGTYEIANGRTAAETAERDATQIAIEGIYRFGERENVFLGARYNTVKAELAAGANDVQIDRVAIGAGWFLTKNILLKGEYVNQKYKDFEPTDIRAGGKFNGYVIQAVVGF
ncbi:porin, partial [Pseudoxanthomonas sp. SGD-10]